MAAKMRRAPLTEKELRTAHLPQRHAMMQKWADYLDELKADLPQA